MRVLLLVPALRLAPVNSWIHEHVPASLQGMGPFEVRWWQWLALTLLIPASLAVALPLVGPTRRLLAALASRTSTTFDDDLLEASGPPLTLLWAVFATRIAIGWIALPAKAHAAALTTQRVLVVIALFWVVLRAVGVLQRSLPTSTWGSQHPGLKSLVPLGGRVIRVFLVVVGGLTVLAQLGFNVGALLAGLGIGGIAVALGAQKTLEHFFGSVSIGLDQPFRVGDWVKIEEFEGEIEAIGLRSTRIRTLERSVISIPNGRLADMRTENFGLRERFRFRTVLTLEYGTPAETLIGLRDAIEAYVRVQPELWPERLVVRLSGLGPYALEVEIMCWFDVATVDEFRAVRERILLRLLQLVAEHGAAFAYPTQTVQLAGGPPRSGVPA